MKKNAQKILLCLYTYSRSERVLFSTSQIRLAVPNMSDGGYRSLLLMMQRNGWVSKESLPGMQYLSITDQGREALKRVLPALNPKWKQWKGEWHAMTFIQAPSSDPQFRYLRQLVIADNAIPLTRGVYLAAGGFSQEILSVCSTLYASSVTVFSVNTWEFGDDRPIIVKYYDLTSVASVYSSISTSIDGLLGILNVGKSRTDQHKVVISTTIDRLWSGLKDDPGFTAYYFPGILDLPSILKKIQLLIQI